jgi:UDPglucose 6-dehydrogenase
MKTKISFVGLGKLGLPLATNLAKKRFLVEGIDLNQKTIKTLQRGNAPWVETDLQSNIDSAEDNITYTTKYDNAHKSDVSIILVNTPTNKKDGSFSNIYVEQSLISLCNNFVENGKKSHHFILSSTVMPRSIKDTFIPLIESITGWTLNKEFGFSYVPDFVAIGKIIYDFENPDFLLIGSSDSHYADEAERIYLKIVKTIPQVRKLNLAEAELSKVALNAYITTKISFANYLGMLSEKVDSTINVDNITDTIGLDKRIGTKYFKAGGPYGGTCFPRDTWAFEKISEKVGLSSAHMLANEKINDDIVTELYKEIIESSPSTIGFIGLGFKPGTSVVTESMAVKLMKRLKNYSAKIFVHDKLDETYTNFYKEISDEKKDISECSSVDELIPKSEVVVYCNDDSYEKVTIIISDIDTIKIIDPWRTI